MCLPYGVSLIVECVECYTETEGSLCIFCLKYADFRCLNKQALLCASGTVRLVESGDFI